jgi:hypothetical protein
MSLKTLYAACPEAAYSISIELKLSIDWLPITQFKQYVYMDLIVCNQHLAALFRVLGFVQEKLTISVFLLLLFFFFLLFVLLPLVPES